MIINDLNSYYIVVKIENQPNCLVLHPSKKYSLRVIDYLTLLYSEDDFIEEVAKKKKVSKGDIKKDNIFIVRSHYVSSENKWKMTLFNPLYKDFFKDEEMLKLYYEFLKAYNGYYNLSQFKSKYLTELGKQDYERDFKQAKSDYISVSQKLVEELIIKAFKSSDIISRLSVEDSKKNTTIIRNPKIGECFFRLHNNKCSERDAASNIFKYLFKFDAKTEQPSVPTFSDIHQFAVAVLNSELKYRPDRFSDTYPEVMFGGKTFKQFTCSEINRRILKENGAQFNLFDDFGLDANPNMKREEEHDPHWVFEPVIEKRKPVDYEDSNDIIFIESIINMYRRGELTISDLRDQIYTYFDNDVLESLPAPLRDKLREFGISVGNGFSL